MNIRIPATVAVTTLSATPTPEPPIVIIATTPSLFTYSLHCTSPELAHRHAQPCDLSSNDRLIAAVVRALSTITTARRTRLLNAYPGYQEYLEALAALPADRKANLEPPLLPLTIRTDSATLIEAAQYLRDETATVDDETNPLKKQLRRFNVNWISLPENAPEIQALVRWAKTECHPGEGATRAEETRQSYRAARSTDETENQDDSVESANETNGSDDGLEDAA